MSIFKSTPEVNALKQSAQAKGTELVKTNNIPSDFNYTVTTTTLANGATTDVGVNNTTQEHFVVDANDGKVIVIPTPTVGPPLIYTPEVSNPLPPDYVVPVGPTPDPPIINVGSGKIFYRFQGDDIIPNQQEIVTRALWSNNEGNLTIHVTSSAQSVSQKSYYYEITNSGSTGCPEEAQYSVVWGHKEGSGSTDSGATVQLNDVPSRAVYGQYRLLCLAGTEERFVIDGTATDSIYAININRARMREYLDEGNLELNLAHLSGSQFIAGGGNNNAHTGSNVKLKGGGAILRLVDDSRINSATFTQAGEVYQMVSGSLEDGVYNSSAPHIYGLMYRRLGIIVLDGVKLNLSASFATVSGSEVAGDNAFKLYKSISGSAQYTDASGDRLGFQGRSAEKVKSTHYFCRVKNAESNFSNNPTFSSGSLGDLAHPSFINDPKVYITTVGLYNDRKELIAVAKLSKPLQKRFTNEALIKVKLDF